MKVYKTSELLYGSALILFIFTSICLYNPEKISTYIGYSLFTVGIVVFLSLRENSFCFKVTKAFEWDFVVYLMFTIYGCLFLAAPYLPYNWDFMIFTAVMNIIVYGIFEHFLYYSEIEILKKVFSFSFFITVIYMLILEKDELGVLGVRFGDGLSGNVNTVGVCLGFFSIIYVYLITNTRPTKKKEKLFDITTMVVVFALMLFTGSKKSIVFLIIDFVLLASHSKNKALSFFYFFCMGVLFLVLIFTNEYMYSIIGVRIQDMIFSLFGVGSGKASHSTDDRAGMIADGFRIFLQNPIFGGGEKYFAVASKKYGYYGYSHCNYTEMLCNFGLVGTLVYYVPLVRNLCILISRRKRIKYAQLGISLLVSTFLIDWMMVSYSCMSVSYIPAMLSFLIIAYGEKIQES